MIILPTLEFSWTKRTNYSYGEELLHSSTVSTSCSTFFAGIYIEVNLPCVDMLAGAPPTSTVIHS